MVKTNILIQVVTSGKVTHEDRECAWNELQIAAEEKKTRPFYRAVNKHGLMYAGKVSCFNHFSSMIQLITSSRFSHFIFILPNHLTFESEFFLFIVSYSKLIFALATY